MMARPAIPRTKSVLGVVAAVLTVSALLAQYYLLHQVHSADEIGGTRSRAASASSALGWMVDANNNGAAHNLGIAAEAPFHGEKSSKPWLRSDETQQKRPTKIIAAVDHIYRETAVKWYDRLTALGYEGHTVIAMDRNTERNLSDRGYRVEYIGGPECNLTHFRNKMYIYRRHIFASRWGYIYQQLRNGTHILLTDVDNTFNRYLPTTELEDAPYDIFHAFTRAVYPKSVYVVWNFALCGGMVWLRATPSVLRLVEQLVKQCQCLVVNCSCACDDQIELNELHLKHNVVWNRRIVVPNSTDYSTWDWGSLEGYCNVTGNRIQVWDRHTAYRGHIPDQRSHCPRNNWVTMPYTPPNQSRFDLPELWHQACGDPNASKNPALLRVQTLTSSSSF